MTSTVNIQTDIASRYISANQTVSNNSPVVSSNTPPVYSNDNIDISNTGRVLSDIRREAKSEGSPYDKQRVDQLKESLVRKPYPAEAIAEIIAEKIVYGY